MRRILPILALAFPALTLAEELPDDSKEGKTAFDVLPDGSQLKGVMLPRYDENRKLVGVLKAEVMRLVNSEELAGEKVSIEFFNDDQTPRGRIDLAQATFHKQKGMLVAKEMVDIKTDRLTARGTALYYSFDPGEGYLAGPVITILQAPTETTMNSRTPSLRATAVLGMSLLSQSLPAAPPPQITGAEMAAIRADAASRTQAAAKEAAASQTRLEKDMADGAAVSQAATRFLVQTGLPAPAAEEEIAPAVPFELKPGPTDSSITCDGGMYFDPDEGVLVYLKNVVVNDPRFKLTAKDQLKIFFGKKPVDEKKEKKKVEAGTEKKEKFGGSIAGNFDKPERIVATGAVLFEQKQTEGDQQPIKASGAIFSYNIKDDQIIISGGSPWITQAPSTYFRAKEANMTLRISPKAGTFVVSEGRKESGTNVEQMDKKNK